MHVYENVRKTAVSGEDRKELVLAFRGTQFGRRADRWTDYKVIKLPFITVRKNKLGWVHMGFRSGYL